MPDGVDPTGLGEVEDAVNACWSMRMMHAANDIAQESPFSLIDPFSVAFIPYQISYGLWSLVDATPVAIRQGSQAARVMMIDSAAKSSDPFTAPIMYGIGLPLNVAGEVTAQGANAFSAGMLLMPVTRVPVVSSALKNPYFEMGLTSLATGVTAVNIADKVAEGDLTPSELAFYAAAAHNSARSYDFLLTSRAAQAEAALRGIPNRGGEGVVTKIRWPDGTITGGRSRGCGSWPGVDAYVHDVFNSIPLSLRSDFHEACGECGALSERIQSGGSLNGGVYVSVHRGGRWRGQYEEPCRSCGFVITRFGGLAPGHMTPFIIVEGSIQASQASCIFLP